MLRKQKILILFFLFNCHCLFGQTFYSDWTDFRVKNWTIKICSDTTKFLDCLSPVGRIQIKNTIDSTLGIKFIVFDKSVAQTSKFKKLIQDCLVRQSCLSIRKDNIESFFHGDFYYFIQPCDKCFSAIEENADCKKLEKYIKTNFSDKTHYPSHSHHS